MSRYTEAWNERLAALTKLLGPADESVLMPALPLYLGGDAEVMTFRDFVPGVTYVTGGLTGLSEVRQRRNRAGNYELMICTHRDEEWAPSIISSLARYTLDSVIEDGHTMDCPMFPSSNLSALLFTRAPGPGRFSFGGVEYHCLLCVGITAKELKQSKKHGAEMLIATLKDNNVFPFTSLERR